MAVPKKRTSKAKKNRDVLKKVNKIMRKYIKPVTLKERINKEDEREKINHFF